MKLDADMYHFNTFHVPRNESVNKFADGNAYKKTQKMS